MTTESASTGHEKVPLFNELVLGQSSPAGLQQRFLTALDALNVNFQLTC